MTLEELRADPDFIAAAKQANPPLDLDGVKEVLDAGKDKRLTAFLLLDDGRHMVLIRHGVGGQVEALYSASLLGLAKALLALLGADKGEG